jgi:cAMP-dependent protein kinase regulator
LGGEICIGEWEEGANAETWYRGKYKVYVQAEGEAGPRAVGGYDNSGSFGELALMYNMPRAATVQADSDGSLWAMDRQTFRRIVLKNAFKKRQMYETLLDQVPMLKTLEVRLGRKVYFRTLLRGSFELLLTPPPPSLELRADEPCRRPRPPELHGRGNDHPPRGRRRRNVFCRGRNRPHRQGRQQRRGEGGNLDPDLDPDPTPSLTLSLSLSQLTRTSKGGYFGELALLTSKPRAATVIAVGNVKVACESESESSRVESSLPPLLSPSSKSSLLVSVLDVDAFERLLGPCMELMKRNVEDYEKQLITIFGSKSNITDIR